VTRSIPAVVISCLLLLAAAVVLASCGSETGVGASASDQAATTQTVTTQAVNTAPVTTGILAEPTTSTTIDYDSMPMTTSVALGIAASKGADLVRQLGDAVISYLGGEGDLDALQTLVAPSAREGLSRMLSSLNRPTDCKVWGISNYGLSNESEVDLLFTGGTSGPAHVWVTVLADTDEETVTITAVDLEPKPVPHAPTTTTVSTPVTTILDAGAAGSSLPVVQIQVQPKLEYMSSYYSYFTAEAVVLAKVVDVLPLRRNPLAGTGAPDGPNAPQPIVYKGYVLEVEKTYGPESIPKRITVYALGNGTVELDGVTYEVRVEFPLDASPGDRLFAPLMEVAYFGTPELKRDEYWVQANLAVYAVDANGRCTRVTGADIDPEAASEYPLSSLENDARAQGKQPSRVE
jgi:hypothetical protein